MLTNEAVRKGAERRPLEHRYPACHDVRLEELKDDVDSACLLEAGKDKTEHDVHAVDRTEELEGSRRDNGRG